MLYPAWSGMSGNCTCNYQKTLQIRGGKGGGKVRRKADHRGLKKVDHAADSLKDGSALKE